MSFELKNFGRLELLLRPALSFEATGMEESRGYLLDFLQSSEYIFA